MIEELVKWLLQFLTTTELFLTGIGLGMLLTVFGVLHLTRVKTNAESSWFSRWRERRMERKERSQHVKETSADIITSGLEDAVAQGTLKRHEVDNIYRQLSQQLGNNNLFQKKLPPAADILEKPVTALPREPLKVRIWKRLENWRLYTPVNIPGPKPGEDTTPVTWRRRTGSDQQQAAE